MSELKAVAQKNANKKEGSTEERESSTAHSQTGKGKKRGSVGRNK